LPIWGVPGPHIKDCSTFFALALSARSMAERCRDSGCRVYDCLKLIGLWFRWQELHKVDNSKRPDDRRGLVKKRGRQRVQSQGAPHRRPNAGSKAAVLALTQSFAKELGPRGINVNAVLPGMIETEMTREAVAARGASVAAETPLRKIGQAVDVARAIAMLASEDSRWMTGQAVRVDGGLT
jgi:NAD(P)-dependent dehydrogenase (short-subunit alcohol dehydrogenase family)